MPAFPSKLPLRGAFTRHYDAFSLFLHHFKKYEPRHFTVAANHGSPWRYDTYVPVIFAGNGLPSKTLFREVETVDVALTLSKYFSINAPSGATGAPLVEVLGK